MVRRTLEILGSDCEGLVHLSSERQPRSGQKSVPWVLLLGVFAEPELAAFEARGVVREFFLATS